MAGDSHPRAMPWATARAPVGLNTVPSCLDVFYRARRFHNVSLDVASRRVGTPGRASH